MPLSKCRICGKYVPNLFRPYHEKVACLEMKRRRGDLIFRAALPRVRPPPHLIKELPKGQKRLLSFGVNHT